MKFLTVFLSTFWATTALACPPEEAAKALTALPPATVSGFASFGPIPLSQPFDVQLLFCGEDADQIKAVDVKAIMPAHQHGMNYAPVVTARGDGRYSVSGMVFHMPGLWEMQIKTTGSIGSIFYTLEIYAR